MRHNKEDFEIKFINTEISHRQRSFTERSILSFMEYQITIEQFDEFESNRVDAFPYLFLLQIVSLNIEKEQKITGFNLLKRV